MHVRMGVDADGTRGERNRPKRAGLLAVSKQEPIGPGIGKLAEPFDAPARGQHRWRSALSCAEALR
jgi:hypothetical protein